MEKRTFIFGQTVTYIQFWLALITKFNAETETVLFQICCLVNAMRRNFFFNHNTNHLESVNQLVCNFPLKKRMSRKYVFF